MCYTYALSFCMPNLFGVSLLCCVNTVVYITQVQPLPTTKMVASKTCIYGGDMIETSISILIYK